MQQRQHSELVPVAEVIADLDGPVKSIREASPQARHHFTQADQVNQLVSASEMTPDLGFMARLLALCSLPRTNPGNRHQYKRANGPYKLVMVAGADNKLPFGNLEYLRSFGLFGLWQLWQSSGPGGRVHFMIAEKSSDVKVKRVSRLAKSKARCCISHNFGGFYQIIPCIRPAVVRIKVAHGCPATIRIFILGRAVQAWQREPGGRPMPPAMEAKGARSTIRERGSRGQGD